MQVLRSLAISGFVLALALRSAFVEPPIAIVNATVIDGTGAPPRAATTVVIQDGVITALQAADRPVPQGARVIDGAGKFVLPGFVDVNAHLTAYSGHEALVRYGHRLGEVAVEMAQLNLKAGVLTVRDSYGVLPALAWAKDQFERGIVPGPRVLAAGNILGWGGPWSATAPGVGAAGTRTLFQEQFTSLITQGAGEELIGLLPGPLTEAVNRYLDKGPDFIKYGATAHSFQSPYLLFSEQAQKVIVEVTHRRGRLVEVHAGSLDGLRMALQAGVDLVQHPEIQPELPDDLIRQFVDKRVTCAVHANMITGPIWTQYDSRPRAPVPQSTAVSRRNAQALIKAGCRIAVASDSVSPGPPEFSRGATSVWTTALAPGSATLLSIEGLVELGMSPQDAIVAATRNGAEAAGGRGTFGTVREGQLADLILLGANPLDDIRNIRKIEAVLRQGVPVNTAALPTRPVWSGGPRD